MNHIPGDLPWAFFGETLAMLRSLQTRVVGSSRSHLGVSPEDAEGLLVEACRRAYAETPSEAHAWLIGRLEEPLDTWLIVEPLGSLYIPVPKITVGKTSFALKAPRGLVNTRIRELVGSDFNGAVAYTKVAARDSRSARLLAADRIAESGAILDLIDRPTWSFDKPFVAKADSGGAMLGFSRSGWIIDAQVINRSGTLIPPYRQLSLVAKLPEPERSDWQRRTLAAARWFSRSCRSSWPAERLVALMIALECLFVPGITEQKKRTRIAQEVTARYIQREMSADEQVSWLEGLYARRNDIAHEGREYEHDLEVDRLADLVHLCVRRAAAHLVPAHRSPPRSCHDYERAMRCTSW
jgi:hypothetical protein